MTRISALTALVVTGAITISVGAYQQPAAPASLEVQKLRDNLYVLRGGGGNTAVFIGSSGVTVVDTKNPGYGAPILAQIKLLTPKPVIRIINTHTHGDHVSGNVEFPATVDVVVQENTRTNMSKMAPVTGLNQAATPNIFTQNGGRGLPKQAFKDRMTLGTGADQIDLYYFGRGHTNGDAWVVFPALRIVHAGDIFSGKNLPLLDANNGGSGVAIGDSLSKAAAGIRNIDSVITGHSTVMTMADVTEYAQFNKDFLASVKAGKAAGKNAEDIATAWKLDEAKYKGYTIADARLKTNVGVVLDELK